MRDQLCVHQQCNKICNEVMCSPKVAECKLERKVSSNLQNEVAQLMVLAGKKCCYDELHAEVK